MDYEIAYCTDKGTHKNVNQDSACLLVADTIYGPMCMAILCDGMGGIAMGEYASNCVMQEFIHWFEETLPDRIKKQVLLEQLGEEWNQLLIDMDARLRQYGKEHNLKLGTTATCMLFFKQQYLLIQSGDSRAYEIKRELLQLSEDQSYVQQQINMGLLTPQEAKNHPKRNVLMSCIGGLRPSIPVCSYGRIKADAHYLLCSDGLIHEVNEEEIFYLLEPKNNRNKEELEENIRQMVEMVQVRGEKDNITAIMVITKKTKNLKEMLGWKSNKQEEFFFHIRQKIILTDEKEKKEEMITTEEEE